MKRFGTLVPHALEILKTSPRMSRAQYDICARASMRSQMILDEYLEPCELREITIREVVAETRVQCREYYRGDIARLACAQH